MIADYVDGKLSGVPWDCPAQKEGFPCDVVLHDRRTRKTRPGHPVAVCRCHAHDLYFTVYPPGFVPHARRPLLEALNPDVPSFGDVAQEAAADQAEAPGKSGGSRRGDATLGRALKRLCEVLGAGLSEKPRENLSVYLRITLHLLPAIANARGPQAQGRALVAALPILSLNSLLLAGALTGCWGPVWRWQLEPPRLVPLLPASLLQAAKASMKLKYEVSHALSPVEGTLSRVSPSPGVPLTSDLPPGEESQSSWITKDTCHASPLASTSTGASARGDDRGSSPPWSGLAHAGASRDQPRVEDQRLA